MRTTTGGCTAEKARNKNGRDMILYTNDQPIAQRACRLPVRHQRLAVSSSCPIPWNLMSRLRLGMLTPSSNTTLEPVTSAMVEALPDVSAHFSRFRVKEIALSSSALGQFDPGSILAAAHLLDDAHCQVIGWSGTSASWLGFDTDAALCALIEAQTDAQACTSVLALNEVLRASGVSRLGLITPYRTDVQSAIVANYATAGIRCAEAHLGIQDNFAFSEVTPAQIRAMAERLMAGPPGAQPEALTILCTNVRAAHLAVELEARYGVPVFDSVSTVVWKALRLAGVETASMQGRWGGIFALPAPMTSTA